MSKKKNYSKMYSSEEEQTAVEDVQTPIVMEEDVAVENPVTEKKPKLVVGTVVNCARLNVREQMNTGSTILCELPASSEVQVVTDEKHDAWYHVFTAGGIEGFCMKQYITIKQ